MLWQVVFFILLCAVFFELTDNTRSEAAVVFGVVKNITGLQSSGPCVFAGHLSFSCAVTATDLSHWKDIMSSDPIIQSEFPSHCIINSTPENEDGVIKRGPSRHTASLSYNLSYFPAVTADKAKKRG